jgi:predicted HAD superfamily Cof-like phosphohydrolase
VLTSYGSIDSVSTMFPNQNASGWLKKPLFHEAKGRKMIPTNFELAGDFMEAFGQDVHVQPTWPDFSTRELRLELIREEYEELEEAIENRDLVEVADALTDLLYVIYGAGHAFGIDLDECYLEVHRSNMSKLGEDGRPMKREDGKVLKGPKFFEPDLRSILEEV